MDEILTAVNAALNGCATEAGRVRVCPGDLNGDGQTTVDEILAGVTAALVGCFEPVSVSSAVAKVKNLLVGLPPTDSEVEAVAADQSVLPELVGDWMGLPEYEDKMLRFFTTAFQQDQWEFNDLIFQYAGNVPFANDREERHNEHRIVQNFQESFARTVIELIAEGQPLTSTMTTTRFMVTPALAAAYATLDNLHVDDHYVLTDLFKRDHPVSVKIQSSTRIPLAESIDPASPNFLNFYDAAIAAPYAANCPFGLIEYPSPADTAAISSFLFSYKPWFFPPTCFPPLVPPEDRYVVDSDFTTWRMVTIREPREGESTTQMYDLQALRTADELVLNKPRVSFFTTPAFGARWPTNDDNQARVLLNQTLIVALGQPIDLTNATEPPSLEALNEQHAPRGTLCYGCHQSLDPMRQFFRQTYTLYFSRQNDPRQMAMNGQFAFHGVSAQGTRISDLGSLLAAHPMFASAWTQKLCTYATSGLCDRNDPEFVRLVDVFTSSNYSWNALVQAMFSSPLVTDLQQTADPVGQSFPIARQAHLCATLSNRLGTTDICGLYTATPDVKNTLHCCALSGANQFNATCVDTHVDDNSMELDCKKIADDVGDRLLYERGSDCSTPGDLTSTCPPSSPPSTNLPVVSPVVRTVAASWPSDQYSRGNQTPALVSDPSLLMRGGMEAMCVDLAQRLVDRNPSSMFQSTDPTTAIHNLVSRLMGLTSDRAAGPQAILQDHFTAAMEMGASASEALQSTFTLACLSPYVVGVGQ